ncbi:MAG: trigger factor [Lachnospiraceae bacterium]|nr:trigger factor [Lachnospiraceae bacterium]
MSLQVENLEHNMAKLTIEATAEEFESSVQKAYQKQKSRISVPGFRKGKAPRAVLEKMYGKTIFYEDAANDLLPVVYFREVEEHNELEITSKPKIDIVQMESGKPFIFTAEVALQPSVELGKYKGLKCTAVDSVATDEEVEKEIEQQREINSRIVPVEDRPIADGDIATIDFKGMVDGEAFEGGEGTDYDLGIGTHSFIDNFEEQLIGKNIGDTPDINVTFPEDYHEKSLAGKAAVFHVTVKGIKTKEMPELDDDFASDVSEFETMDEYREDVRRRITERKEKEAKAQKEDELIKAIVEDSNMDIPDAMVETETDQLMENYRRNVMAQGLTMELYLRYINMPEARLRADMKEQALKNIQSRLVLKAIADKEGIEVSEEDMDAEMEKLAKQYHVNKDKVHEIMDDDEGKTMRQNIAIEKAADLVIAESVEEEPKKEE